MEAEIIAPIPKEVLKAELTEDKRLRMTSKSNNEVYVITWQDSPNVVREIGRLREIAFRAAGGGTGQDCDLDKFDTMENPYKQLIVWNPEAEEIIGGYRYILGPDIQFDEQGQPILATSHMFHFSDKFIKEYLPHTIELGRSFVTLEYQSTRSDNKSIFALDNLWDGLGALAVIMPGCKYCDKDELVIPTKPLELEHDPKEFEELFCEDTFKDDYRILNHEVRALGYNIPPLVNAYMSLSPTMKMFGTAINYGFGDVEETGILIAVSEIYDEKRIRYVDNFAKEHPEYVQITSGANKVIYEPSNKKELEDDFEPVK